MDETIYALQWRWTTTNRNTKKIRDLNDNNTRACKRAVEANDGAALVTILRCAGAAYARGSERASCLVSLWPVDFTCHICCDFFFPLILCGTITSEIYFAIQ